MKIKIQLDGQPVTLSVPEGMDPHQYAEQVSQRHAGQEKYTAADDSALENFSAGVGQGVANVGRNLGNIVSEKIVSDEELERADELDADLLNTKSGQAGSFVGELVATAPLAYTGGAVSAGAKGLRMAKAAKLAGSTGGKMIAEGAATGFVLGDHDNRLGSAATAATISGGTAGSGKFLKKALTKPWAKKTAEATELESMIGKNIPLSQSAEPGIVRDIYEGLVANIPGGSKKLRGQYDDVMKEFREFIIEEASPPGVDRIIGADDTMQSALGKLQQVWDDAYDLSFKEAPIVLFEDVFKPPKIWAKFMPEGAPNLKPGMQVTGQDVITAKLDVQNAINKLDSSDFRIKEVLENFKTNLDDVLKDNLNPSGKGRSEWAGELKRYFELNDNYAKFQDVLSAAKKGAAAASEFSPQQLLKSTAQRAGKKGVSGGGALNREALLAEQVLTGFNNKPGIFQSVAALGLVSGLMSGAGPGAATVLAPMAIARGVASPKVQQALVGELPSQKMVADALRKNKKNIYRGVSAANRAAAIGVAEQ